jgi:hypothetical protein
MSSEKFDEGANKAAQNEVISEGLSNLSIYKDMYAAVLA